MTIPYLEKLNPQQRHAVEHGGQAGPLLIIAGAQARPTRLPIASLISSSMAPRDAGIADADRRSRVAHGLRCLSSTNWSAILIVREPTNARAHGAGIDVIK
jgi:hypothetical protein